MTAAYDHVRFIAGTATNPSTAISDFANANPDYLVQPITNAQAAALLHLNIGALNSARHYGLAPPGFVPVSGLGYRYSSRHAVILWLAHQVEAGAKADEVTRILVTAYPFLHMSQDDLLKHLARQHWHHFNTPMTKAACAAFFGKTPDGLRQASRRNSALDALAITVAGRRTYPNRREVLEWTWRHFTHPGETPSERAA